METMGDEWAERDDTKYISEQIPDCVSLPISCRYRSFSTHSESSQVRYYGSEHDFFVCKKKRFEGAGESFDTPVSPVHTDAFTIAQHQYQTLRWLGTNRTAEEILVRFSTDRKQGAPPTIASLNRAIRLFRQSQRVDAMLELVEEIVIGESAISVSTVHEIMTTLSDDPLRAAQLLFLFQNRMGCFTIPTHLWSRTASLLAKKSYTLSLITDEFLWIFENVLEIVRSYGDSLDETALIAFGRCLLASGQPLTSAIRLVQDELLTGRNMVSKDGPSDYLLSAFLSDLLVVLCGCDDVDNSKVAMSTSELLNFTSDVIKFSYARKVSITSKAFDTVIRLLDTHACYQKLCIAFGAMSVLTAPTTVSLLRVLEVVHAFPKVVTDVWQNIYGTVDVSSFVVWCVTKHKSLLAPSSQTEEEHANMAIGACLGKLMASELDREQRYLYDLFTLLVARNPRVCFVFVSTLVTELRRKGRQADAIPFLSLLDPMATQLIIGVEATGLSAQEYHRSFDDLIKSTCDQSLDVYFNVVTHNALGLLARNSRAAEAFERMMDGYMSKTGALLLVPPDFFFQDATASILRGLVCQWTQKKKKWMVFLPLFASLHVKGKDTLEVCFDIFERLTERQYKKVAFIASTPEETECASRRGIHPIIDMKQLLARLKVVV